MNDASIVQYVLGRKAAQQLTELCYYLNSVSSPTHTSAMCYSTQTANSLQQYDAQSYCTALKYLFGEKSYTFNIWQCLNSMELMTKPDFIQY